MVRVGNHMVSVRNEETDDVVVMREWEVEEVLKTHPDIKEVGVIGVKDIKVGENIKALVVLESDARGKLSESDIVAYCKDKLAHYKIPRIVEFVGEIPKTDIGKVSRRELREEEL